MIPASVMEQMATLGLSPEQAKAVASIITTVERETRDDMLKGGGGARPREKRGKAVVEVLPGLGEAAPKTGTRISADFYCPPEVRQFGRAVNLTDRQIDDATSEFCDYWRAIPGARGRKLDWPATLRNRLREVAARFSAGDRRFGYARKNNNGMASLVINQQRQKMESADAFDLS